MFLLKMANDMIEPVYAQSQSVFRSRLCLSSDPSLPPPAVPAAVCSGWRNYRRRLRQTVRRYDLSVLDYCLTSNHLHLLAFAGTSASSVSSCKRSPGNLGRNLSRPTIAARPARGPIGVIVFIAPLLNRVVTGEAWVLKELASPYQTERSWREIPDGSGGQKTRPKTGCKQALYR